MSWPRVSLAAAGALVVLGALVLLGHWEARHHARVEVQGMSSIRALVGPLDQPALSGYRVLPDFDCLVYRRDGNAFALELCVDGSGRLVEAIDRRHFDRRIYSLREDPSRSTIRLDRTEVDRLLQKMGARA